MAKTIRWGIIGTGSRRLKRHWRDGTTHMIFEPLELVEKLAAFVPPPRFNLFRYHRILAPASSKLLIGGLPNVTLAGTKVFPASVQVRYDV